jgi:acetate kinase
MGFTPIEGLVMVSLDVLVFTGGVGENAAAVRSESVAGLGFLGLAIHETPNASTRPDCEIGSVSSNARILVVHSREDLEMARQTRALLT